VGHVVRGVVVVVGTATDRTVGCTSREGVGTMTRIEQFILELTRLSKKHGVIISGCGCCNSPDVSESSDMDPEAGYAFPGELVWVSPSDKYCWMAYRKRIVREKKKGRR
jgi:hypothetical protein